MFLKDIPPGSSIELVISRYEKSKSFRTKVENITDNGIIALVPMAGSSEFTIKETDGISVIFKGSEGLLLWVTKLDNLFKIGNMTYLKLSCSDSCKKHNRRNSYRVNFISDIVIKKENQDIKATIKDISISGIGFVCHRELVIGEKLDVRFIIYGEEIYEVVTVVRKVESSSGIHQYGVTFEKTPNRKIERHMGKLQMEELKRIRGIK